MIPITRNHRILAGACSSGTAGDCITRNKIALSFPSGAALSTEKKMWLWKEPYRPTQAEIDEWWVARGAVRPNFQSHLTGLEWQSLKVTFYTSKDWALWLNPKPPVTKAQRQQGALIWMICRVSTGHLKRGLENSLKKFNTIPVLMVENEA